MTKKLSGGPPLVFVPRRPDEGPDHRDRPNWAEFSDGTYVRLLDGAWNALHVMEPDAISLGGLAREIGISSQATYKHFRDKEALLGTLAGIALGDFLGRLPGVLAGMLPQVAHAWVGFAERRPRHYALGFSLRFAEAERYPKVALRRNRLRSYVRELAEEELGRPVEEPEAHGLWGIFHGAASLVAMGEARQPLPSLVFSAEAYLEALRHRT